MQQGQTPAPPGSPEAPLQNWLGTRTLAHRGSSGDPSLHPDAEAVPPTSQSLTEAPGTLL